MPLLDEAAELLGDVDAGQRTEAERRAEAERSAEVRYADLVQDVFGGQAFVSAEELAGRYAATSSLGSVADRAAGDRGWVFGHIVVDEAQELSAMTWRVLMRRAPSRSMTLVGDVAQTGSSAGATSWARALRPHVGDRWQLAELTVNYRTPAQIMDIAGAVMHAGGIAVRVPTSARVGRHEPEYTRVAAAPQTRDDVDAATSRELIDVVRAEHELAEGGTVAVITSRAAHVRAAAMVEAALPAALTVVSADSMTIAVAVLTVDDAKGLEFDVVVLVEPGEIVAESPRGLNDLYVALTRPTQRLHVVHARELPAGMG